MRKITKHTAFLKPFATLAAMSAVTVAPLIGGSQVAQADPPNHAPAYGWRGDNNDDYDYRNGDDRDRDYPYNGGDGRGNSDRDGYVYGERSTLRGTVTRDLKGDYFELRADNGQVFRVLARNGEPTRLTANDRVQLSGYFDNNLFVADNINFLRDYGNNGKWNNGLSRKVNFPGRVVAIRSYTRLVVRGDNGHDYDVEISKGLSSSIRVGDRVRVAGRGEGNWVQANSVKR
ncbi:MAG: hypothetical protein JOZ57_08640 [Abitibacteriaceae bacterium]|nr:hypothetical protein [Abditibacteriaceae bacterium]